MRKLSKKAFTLIEILGAITILGILSIVAIISVNKIIQRAKNEHYTTAEKNFTLAAQSYIQQNRNNLPKVIGQKKKVQLKTLIENNYIDKIIDYKKNECYTESSYVQIFKYSQTDYSYLAYLDCPARRVKESKSTESKTDISISMEPNPDKSETSNLKDAKAKITITDEDKLFSYSYIVYRNGKEVFSSGNQLVEDYGTEVKKTIKLSDHTPATIKVVVTAINIYGNPKTVSVTKKYKDTQAPECIIKEEDKEKNPKPWITSGTRKITVGCDDGNGVGCTRKTYSKTFKTDTKIGTIKIEDEEGNQAYCKVSVYIDKTAPTCSVTKSGKPTFETWYKQYVDITLNKSDNLSGIKSYGLSTSSNVSYNNISNTTQTDTNEVTWYGKVIDEAGNESTVCNSGSFKVDTTPPSVPSISLRHDDNSNYNQGWTNRAVTQYQSSSDSGIGGVYYQYCHDNVSWTSMPTNWKINWDGSWTFYTRACDKLGNCSASAGTYSISIDTVRPTMSWGEYEPGTHKNSKGIKVNSTCSDNSGGSGINSWDASESTDVSPTKSSGVTVYHSCEDLAGNKADIEGVFKVKKWGKSSSCNVATCTKSCCGYASCRDSTCPCEKEVTKYTKTPKEDSCNNSAGGKAYPQVSLANCVKKGFCKGYTASECTCKKATGYTSGAACYCDCKTTITTSEKVCELRQECPAASCGDGTCTKADCCGYEECWHYS